MLRALKESEYKNYLDWAYSLALDMSRSGYPTYADGLKKKSEFEEASACVFEREHEEILLFEEDGKALGWLHYFALPEDKYLDTRAFCTEDRTEQAMDELVAYLARKYQGFTMHFGFSDQNTRAVNHLIELGWPLNEESRVGVMRFEEYEPKPESTVVIPITKENFDRFAAIHAQWDGKMYWDNAHLREALDTWQLYLLERDRQDIAVIYFFCMDGMLEIFGLDYAGGKFDQEALRALLVRALNQGKAEGMETFTYFHDTDEAPTVKELGIRSLGRYVMYAKEL
ncbi:hypothetical protein D7X94_03445 [Acutalibacter sp. 1XD8-33]|uniref:hypothetical protein n=1 Tax=Acutalibacter sp. 1XD8-33 TaxID=2320081 RepID=UPI000EA33551|nr:hypothetical protein [Acutalibacter sp. 1XD8-33]RKJ41357.1 hypothetical protein D7X94_03445 [Acutalibacter sp. 1XD8-33]